MKFSDKKTVKKFILTVIFILHGLAVSADFKDPRTGKTYRNYEVHSVIEENFTLIKDGKSGYTLAEYTKEFNKINPNSKNSFAYAFMNNLDGPIKAALRSEDYDQLNDLIPVLQGVKEADKDGYHKIDKIIGILQHGTSVDALSTIDQDLLKYYVQEYSEIIPINTMDTLLSTRSDLDKEAKDAIIQGAFEQNNDEYDFSDLESELDPNLVKMISKNNVNISAQVCGSLELLYEYISEDEDRGTLYGFEYAAQYEAEGDGEFLEQAREAYAYNVETVAASLIKFEQLGYGLDTYCSDTTTIRDILYYYNETLNPQDILNDIKAINDVNQKDCYTSTVAPKLSDIFGQCDIQHIIWRLEREDRKDLHHNQTLIFGEGMDKCEIMIQMSVKGLTKTTELKLISKTDTQTFLGTTNQVIRMITK